MKFSSPVFQDNGTIPVQYTCEAQNQSPPLSWSDVPRNAESLAIIMDDPDAPTGTFVHWVIFNIAVTLPGLEENLPPDGVVDSGAVQGINDFKKIGYGGPCPPKGTHRYFFKLYALDTYLEFEEDEIITKDRLLNKMKGHILADTYFVGTYKKNKEDESVIDPRSARREGFYSNMPRE